MECSNVCPTNAIEKMGKYMSLEETLKEIEKDKPFYENSGGGVTFSGGEPLIQCQFLLEICRLCNERNISTALDTTGYARWEIMEKVLEYVDLVLYDIKHLNPGKHIEATGVSNEIILENFKKTASKVKTWLRIPIIPGFNDSSDHINELIGFSKGLSLEKISLLPCHTWGEPKYERLGRIYSLEGTASMAPESLEEIKDHMESKGLVATIGR
jgi:pyruvate formate lyase activating enzyme